MNDLRPLIGVTQADRGDRAALWSVRLALALAGARSIVLMPGNPRHDFALKGLLLGGGADVHPSLFAAAPKSHYPYDFDRETMELAWLNRAWSTDLPTLGICRGAQLMNVAAGGALHQNIARDFPRGHYPIGWFEQMVFRKRVMITPGSRLAGIAGAADLSVNSLHSQAVSRLGNDLSVCAREANGVIQAIEAPSKRFWLGVQFHPEFLIYQQRFRCIFRAFIQAAV